MVTEGNSIDKSLQALLGQVTTQIDNLNPELSRLKIEKGLAMVEREKLMSDCTVLWTKQETLVSQTESLNTNVVDLSVHHTCLLREISSKQSLHRYWNEKIRAS
jgi:hypothetical protein